MSTFLQNWMIRRAMSAPRAGGEEKVWERVQYISRSIQNSAIDLGIATAANLNVEVHLVDFNQWAAGGWGGCFISTHQQTNTANLTLWANNTNTAYMRAGYGNTSNLDGGQYEWTDTSFGSETVLERRGADVYIDGAYAMTSNGTFTAESGITLCLGGKDFNDGCFPANFADVIVRTQYGGSIIAHFIPVKILSEGPIDQLGRTISVGVGCLYDLVTKQFYAATYGSDFVAGPAVTTEYINFVDPAVEAICATNWGDGVGLTYAQAAAVTYIGQSPFMLNSQITSFDELSYFTGGLNIEAYAFYGCSNLTSITLPSNLQSLGAHAFNSSGLTGNITIPASATIHGAVFFNTAITSVTMLATTPPSLSEGDFLPSTISAIYVPAESVSAYQAASVWSNYASIIQAAA